MRCAGYQDIPALRRIWAACFEEDTAYLDLFFSQGFPLGKTLLLEQGGAPASVLTLLPCTCRAAGTEYPAAYIYGVATAPEHQGRGLGTALLAQADHYLQEQGVAMAFLAPASQGLFGFYAKRGFAPQVYLEKERFSSLGCPGTAAELLPVGAEEYERLRRQYLPGDAVLWDKPFLQYAAREAAFHQGGLYWVKREGEAAGCCGVYLSQGQVLVKELLCPKEQRAAAIAAIQRLHPGKRVEAYFPGNSRTGTPYACAKWYREAGGSERELYASLVLD